jgi:hypothetical protein
MYCSEPMNFSEQRKNAFDVLEKAEPVYWEVNIEY